MEPMSLLSDEKRLRKKELGVFQELYEQYYSRMVLFAMSLVYDQNEAEDIVQEVFYYLWDKAETIEVKTSLKNYLFKAVSNAALNRIRHYHIRDSHAEQIREAWYLALEPDPDSDEERLARIQEVVDKFPYQMQSIFLLRIRDGKKYEEIAHELGISLNTVKTQLKRAFRLIREKLC
jgi:RNA polymerase sigma-70 factor (ECF subfamily)